MSLPLFIGKHNTKKILMVNDAMYKTLFMDKPWLFSYDKFVLEVNVRKREKEHWVKCSYHKKGTGIESHESVAHFFNELVWFYDVNVHNLFKFESVGSHVGVNYSVNQDRYLLNFQQRIVSPVQHLALAFYREASCNESAFYRFLCFSKIIEIPFKKNDRSISEWVEKQIASLKTDLAKTYLKRKLKVLNGQPLGRWLIENGRHAIAHAHEGSFIRDPNDYQDWDEIRWANTLMQELAVETMVQKIGVPSKDSV